ncbi:MAG: helix-turn-helix domain-containing protein [Actinomycetota bacterium]|nr:helix-turn-helix domain-containing protein [Actinomycetota bacterium]
MQFDSATARPAGRDTHGEAPTRQRVVRVLLERRTASAAELAEALGLTAAGVRRHLDHLAADGHVEPCTQSLVGPAAGTRGRGRPARHFRVTDAGRDALEQGYDDLAVSALRFLAETGGNDAVLDFARRRWAEVEDRVATGVAAAPAAKRPDALARALTADGYAASVRPTPHGDQVCQHHCPVAHVAAEFPQLCEAETEFFARLLGRHVQRLATIAHGDGVCTTNVPRPHIENTTANTHGPPAERTTA